MCDVRIKVSEKIKAAIPPLYLKTNVSYFKIKIATIQETDFSKKFLKVVKVEGIWFFNSNLVPSSLIVDLHFRLGFISTNEFYSMKPTMRV